MLDRIHARLKTFERKLAGKLVSDVSTPEGRRAAWWHFQLFDHAFLRIWWTNFAQVAPGVFRANQPSPARLARYRDMGIRSIVNLRAGTGVAATFFEQEACEDLGLTLHDVTGMSARRPPNLDTIKRLEEVLRQAERPVLMHCKSGSDRAGLAAALYLLLVEDRPVAEAARQLNWRFMHLKRTKTGVLDHILRVFERDAAASGIGFREWLETRYDPVEIARSFEDWRKGRWDGTA